MRECGGGEGGGVTVGRAPQEVAAGWPHQEHPGDAGADVRELGVVLGHPCEQLPRRRQVAGKCHHRRVRGSHAVPPVNLKRRAGVCAHRNLIADIDHAVIRRRCAHVRVGAAGNSIRIEGRDHVAVGSIKNVDRRVGDQRGGTAGTGMRVHINQVAGDRIVRNAALVESIGGLRRIAKLSPDAVLRAHPRLVAGPDASVAIHTEGNQRIEREVVLTVEGTYNAERNATQQQTATGIFHGIRQGGLNST